MTDRQQRRSVLAALLALLSLPVLLAAGEALAFHLHNRENGAIESGGERRTFLLHVPRTYDESRPTPLVISLHGAALWPAVQRDVSQWNTVADEYGFLVVYPSGVARGGPRIWRIGWGKGLERDVRFIGDLIDALGADYNIDRSRVYVDGLSNGGGMAYAFSCALPERVAAVGMVAPALLYSSDLCQGAPAVPVIAFHGTQDPVTPYRGGVTWVAPRAFPDIEAFVAAWARRNGCGPDPSTVPVAADVDRLEFTNCTGDATAVLYAVRGGGHTWPGGGPLPEWFAGATTRSIDATRTMWAFFQEHPKRQGS